MFSLTITGVAVAVAFFLYRPTVCLVGEYTPLFLKQLGYEAKYIGLAPLLGFVTQLVGIPLLSYLADKFRARKLFLFLSILISVPSTLLFLAVPAPQPACEISRGNSTGPNDTMIPWSGAFLNKTAFIVRNPLDLTKNTTSSSRHINLSSEARPTESHTQVFKNNLHVDSDQGRLEFFLIFMFLRGILELSKRLTMTLITVAAVTHLKNDKTKFGYYACWGDIGSGIWLFLVGISLYHIEHLVCGKLVPHYVIIYFFAVGLQVLTLGTLPWLKFEYLEHRVIDYAEVKSVLTKPHYILILVICFHCGLCATFQTQWEFWYMKKLGGSSIVMAVGGSLRRLLVAVYYVISRRVIDLFGELNVIAISLLSFAVSFVGLAFIEDAWLVIFFDNFQAASYVFSFSSFVIHFSKAGSVAASAFFQGLVSVAFLGIGKEIGNAITGWLFTSQGTRITLCGYSVATALLLVIFLIHLRTAKSKDLDVYMKLVESDTGSEKNSKKKMDKRGEIERRKLTQGYITNGYN